MTTTGRRTCDATTTAGTVRGFWRDGSAAFLGIPFAEPPVGALRFAAPVAVAPWQGVREAFEHGPTPQRVPLQEVTLIPEPSIPGESILNLDVFTPQPGGAARLPVLVWIHGGGFVAGSPASPWYDGAAFNRDGIVTVTLSYRLGFEGFGVIDDSPNNRGLLDMVLALQWVRDNIAAFGGDPQNVTIAGQSAGGGAVLTLLAVPRAATLFHRVISISGALADVPLEKARDYTRRLAERGGVAPTKEALATLDQDRILELQKQLDPPFGQPEDGAPQNPLESLAAFAGGPSLGPVVDGEVLPRPTPAALRDGAAAGKAVLLGSTDHEFGMATAALEQPLAAVPFAQVAGAFGLTPDVAAQYAAAHPGLGTATLVGLLLGDRMIRSTVRTVADLLAQQEAPTWVYRFSWASPTVGSACHCLDLPFFFDCLAADRVDAIAGPQPPRSLAQDVHGAAVAFIAHGDPGWPRYTRGERTGRMYAAASRTIAGAYDEVAMLAG